MTIKLTNNQVVILLEALEKLDVYQMSLGQFMDYSMILSQVENQAVEI